MKRGGKRIENGKLKVENGNTETIQLRDMAEWTISPAGGGNRPYSRHSPFSPFTFNPLPFTLSERNTVHRKKPHL